MRAGETFRTTAQPAFRHVLRLLLRSKVVYLPLPLLSLFLWWVLMPMRTKMSVILSLLSLCLHGADFQVIFVVNELAFVSVSALPGRLLVPLFAHFSLVVLIELLWSWFHD